MNDFDDLEVRVDDLTALKLKNAAWRDASRAIANKVLDQVGEKLVADIVARAVSEEFEQQLVECVLDELARQVISEWRRNG